MIERYQCCRSFSQGSSWPEEAMYPTYKLADHGSFFGLVRCYEVRTPHML